MDECAKVIYNVLESMRYIAVLLSPYCPNISKDILEQIEADEIKNIDSLNWGSLKTGKITEKEKIKPVFLRLDSEFATDKKKG